MTVSCKIIGVLDDGIESLSSSALRSIQQANVVIGAERTLALFNTEFTSNTILHDLTGKLSSVPGWIETAIKANQQVVVLATGDPLCHGIASYLNKKLGAEILDIIPNVSTLQLACARTGMTWQDMKICSIHTQDTGEWAHQAGPEHGMYKLYQDLRQNDKLAVFTSPENGPVRIAQMLKMENMADQFTMSIAENLATPNEKVFKWLNIEEVMGKEFNSPNIVLLERIQPEDQKVLFGLADDAFHQRKPEKGLITKREVRAVSLARMQLRANSVVWDIGAGSGSVGLEAARIAADGYVCAIEKNAADLKNIEMNRVEMGIGNYTAVHAKAPECLESWPDPDAIFIGGSGGELSSLIEICLTRLRADGYLVMNFVTLENLAQATETLKKLNAYWDVTQIQVSRSQPILNMNRMAAENPVWIVSAQANNDV